MRGRMQGKSVWISGGASGIGEATALLLASEGANVCIADIQTNQGIELERKICDAGGFAIFTVCDVSLEEDIRKSMERTAEVFGDIHALVNCAGIIHISPLEDYSVSEWDNLMAINLRSIYLSIRHGIQYLRKHSQSTIINVGSISSFVGQASTPAYTASKYAVHGLSRSIALDYAADGVRCNCVCPGITDTPMLRHHLKSETAVAALETRLHRVPIGRLLTSHEIAKAVLYLASDDSSGVTGTSLVVDGGYTAAAEWNRTHITLPTDLQ